jgi:hypothetical protein
MLAHRVFCLGYCLRGGLIYVRAVVDDYVSITTVPSTRSLAVSSDLTQLQLIFVLPVEQSITAGNHNVKIQTKATRSNAVNASGMIVAIHHN